MPKKRDTKVEVVVMGERHTFSTADEMLIDRDDLDTELAQQAAHFGWFAVLRDRARMERLRAEAAMDAMEQELFLKYRDRPTGEKITVDAIKAKARTDPEYAKAIDRYQNADYTERLMGSFVDALSQRKDMIISLARSRHLEMSSPSADEVERIKKNLLGR